LIYLLFFLVLSKNKTTVFFSLSLAINFVNVFFSATPIFQVWIRPCTWVKDKRATNCAANHFWVAKSILLKTTFIDLRETTFLCMILLNPFQKINNILFQILNILI
jgi:hypothetical protein